jgi:hypothetical protein
MIFSHLPSLRPSFAHIFYTAALTPAVAIIAYGGMESMNATAREAAAKQIAFDQGYTLKYADGKKALIKTEDGLLDVAVGSFLSNAGYVTAIELRNGLWTVTTSKHLTLSKK